MSREGTTRKLPEQVILLNLNSRLFALDLKIISEIILPNVMISRLPMTPPHIKGLILSREQMYPLVQFGSSTKESDDTRILLLNLDNRYLAILVDALLDIVMCTPEMMIDSESSDILYTPFSINTTHGEARFIEITQLYVQLIQQANQLDQSRI